MRYVVIIALFAAVASAGLLDPEDLGDGFEDLLDLDKFDDLCESKEIKGLINDLTNVTDNTKKSLHSAVKLHQHLGDDGKEHLHNFFQFIVKFGKEYENVTTTSQRFGHFRTSLKRVESRQKQSPTAKFGITKFSDLSPREFTDKHTGVTGVSHVQKLHSSAKPAQIRAKRQDIPDSFDWRDYNGVTSIKNQGQCGCCYAFAAVGAIESQYKIQTGEELDLSEEQMVACTYRSRYYDDNNGCNGGSSPGVFRYAINNGITTEEDWGYTLVNTGDNSAIPRCQRKESALSVSSQEQLPSGDEVTMASVVASSGPVVTYLDAGPLQDYQGGIINARAPAGGWRVTHAILTVGYGDEDGTPYWIMKNQWGDDWGEGGFFRVIRGTNSLLIGDYSYQVQL
uniref:Cathepsin L-like cysteine proteinase n=1 Tax=Bursaphelenchus xylophilus TaxID=6326 RepID=A0A3G4YQS3_BURXY|nr:cathepsin L-like cysteine proteinase [Bursaphelenchus xylophilus]